MTVKMTLSSNEQAFLAKHHGRRLKVAVKLLFTPKHGGKLSLSAPGPCLTGRRGCYPWPRRLFCRDVTGD